MKLTQEEKQFLLELLSKLQFGINGIEQAQFAKGIALKLQDVVKVTANGNVKVGTEPVKEVKAEK